jgi:hypothetical protein
MPPHRRTLPLLLHSELPRRVSAGLCELDRVRIAAETGKKLKVCRQEWDIRLCDDHTRVFLLFPGNTMMEARLGPSNGVGASYNGWGTQDGDDRRRQLSTHLLPSTADCSRASSISRDTSFQTLSISKSCPRTVGRAVDTRDARPIAASLR